eukprot:TRINITY_DN8435_c0_g2_i1.p1 TRINITY_DN8435_c0_g2~~TRINITY_DN8435_c0_g2_i1.p1  ORF type:complete len:132 (-),score=7.22 TRINITY_DN8435_c0_g2_i1:52-426(-)
MSIIMQLCAAYEIAFGVFHLTFPALLQWQDQLSRLSSDNRVVVPTLNEALTLKFFTTAYLYIRLPHEIKSTKLGYSLRVCITLFWLWRMIVQMNRFNTRRSVHRYLTMVFGVGVFLNAASLKYR